MYPPSHICKRLYELDPQVRLAWEGRPPKFPGELNPGSFALVQLWRKDHYGASERPKVALELWNWRPKRFPDGHVDLVYIDRGPVFNRHGGFDPDWGRDYELIYRVNLLAFGIKNEEVLSGAFLEKLTQWYSPMKKRMEDSRNALLRDINNTAEAIGHEVGRDLYRNLQRHDVTLPVQTAEDARRGFEADQVKNAKKESPF